MGLFDRLLTFPQIFDDTSPFSINSNLENNKKRSDSNLIEIANSSPSGSPDEVCAVYELYNRHGFDYVERSTNLSSLSIQKAIGFVGEKLCEYRKTWG